MTEEYKTYLLEYIGYALSPGNQEFPEWRKDFRERISKLSEDEAKRYATSPKTEVSKETNQPQQAETRPATSGVSINDRQPAWKSKK